MNSETLVESFGHIADAPGGIDKLRGIVLDLAVNGRLVCQDPSDEPASELLSRVCKEREGNERRRRARRHQPAISEEAGGVSWPYPAPAGWAWSTLGALFGMQAGKNVPSGTIREAGSYPCYGGNGIRGYVDSFNRDGSHPIIGRQGALCGNVKIAHGRFFATEHAVVVDVFAGTSVTWAGLALRALNLNQYATATAQPGLSVERISEVPIPVPPLAEQLRIVERVTDLTALCDQLERQQAARVEARSTLTASTLKRVVEAEPVNDLRAAVRAFADNIGLHLAPGQGDLAALNRVRQTILELALRGRLTRHSTDDEPASRLVERANASRGALPRRGGQRSAPSPLPGTADVPFSLPDTWQWHRLGEICQSRLGKMLDDRKNTGVPRPYLRNTNVQWGRFNLDDIKEIRLEDDELEEYSLRDGDLLVVEGGEPARCAIWDNSLADGVMVFQKALHRVRPGEGVSARYIALVLRNGVDSGRITELFTGSTIKHLTGEKLKGFLVPLPPTAEQHRIVDRVTDLFALCDDLEGQLSAASTLRGDVAASVAAHAASSPTTDNDDDVPLVAEVGTPTR